MSEYSSLWIDDEVRSFGIEVPRWIDQDITCSTVAAVLQGGCESGAYMPAVTYHQALKTMEEHDEDILSVEAWDHAPDVFEIGWCRLACALVSAAVEAWCAQIADDLAERIAVRAD